MFITTNVQRHTAHVTLMQRSYDFGHHRIMYATGKVEQCLGLIRNALLHQRNLSCTQQGTYLFRIQIAILHLIDEPAYGWHIHTIQLNIATGRTRGIEYPRQGCTQSHFVCKIDMPLPNETLDLRTGRHNRGQDREDRFLATLHLPMKQIQGIIQFL